MPVAVSPHACRKPVASSSISKALATHPDVVQGPRLMKTYTLLLISALAFTGCDKSGDSAAPTPATEAATPATKEAAKPKAETAEDGKAAAAKPATKTAAAAAPAADGPKPGDLPAPPDVAAAPADATKTESGLSFKVLVKGTGTEKPAAEDTVKVHYTGWTTDGKMFDSSVKRGKPTEFPLNGVIKGWTEGVGLMTIGEKRRFWIPGNLAYGETPRRPGAPAGTLVFDVELLEIKKAPSPGEMKKLFGEYEAALKDASAAVCKCEDMGCAQPAMMKLRGIRPPGRPSPEQMQELQPYMQKIQECMQKIRKPATAAPAPPAGKAAAPAKSAAPAPKK
jgi:FKBP-type peptidyl-prolyl cis-trans isomerase